MNRTDEMFAGVVRIALGAMFDLKGGVIRFMRKVGGEVNGETDLIGVCHCARALVCGQGVGNRYKSGRVVRLKSGQDALTSSCRPR